MITEVIFIRMKTKVCNNNIQGNRSLHDSPLDRKSETPQLLSLLMLHAAVKEFVTLNSPSSASSQLSSGGSNSSFVLLPFFVSLFLFPGNLIYFLWLSNRSLRSWFLFRRTVIWVTTFALCIITISLFSFSASSNRPMKLISIKPQWFYLPSVNFPPNTSGSSWMFCSQQCSHVNFCKRALLIASSTESGLVG